MYSLVLEMEHTYLKEECKYCTHHSNNYVIDIPSVV